MVSIIVPAYNVEKMIEKCLNSIIRQTYSQIEIIVVNDGSIDSTRDIVLRMADTDSRIKLIDHEKNCGLFRARMTGVKASSGDYIGFVDSDDYISIDYYRNLLEKAESTKSDIVVAKLVQEDETGYQWIQNLYEDFEYGCISGEKIYESYWMQEGQNFTWHTVWNKLYSRTIWEKAYPILDLQKEHLIMCEDFVFSSVLFFFAQKLECVKYARYYYYRNSNASTALNDDPKKMKKNIGDLILSFDFVRNFLDDNSANEKIIGHYRRWEALYKYFWTQNVINSNLLESDKTSCIAMLNNAFLSNDIPKFPGYFYSAATKYDNRYEKLIDTIASDDVTVVSFDIFDTALMRPLYSPSDLFKLLDKKYKKINPYSGILFSKIREEAEKAIRKRKIYDAKEPVEDITIDDIYDEIFSLVAISKDDLLKMKNAEIALEEELLTRRESIFNLYKLALCLKKKIIFVSDMYIGVKDLIRILKKNGYTSFDHIYVSCEQKASKRTGTLYKKVKNELEISAERILHIGDNWQDDVLNARNEGYRTAFYPKTIECLSFGISDVKTTHAISSYNGKNNSLINFQKSLNYLGNRCAIAVAANKLYDMPFYSYNEWSEMNASPQFFGRLALGLHLLGVVKWISEYVQKNGYDKLVFIARDGYLPLKAFEVLAEHVMMPAVKTEYFYTSRKAALLCGIERYEDLYTLYEALSARKLTGAELIKMFQPVIIMDANTKRMEKSILDKRITNFEEYCDFINNVIKKCFNAEKARNYNKSVKNYFDSVFTDNSALVDIGYSGRTQEMIYKVTGKAVDGFYIHKNDEECCKREKEYGFEVIPFYDFTPSITGAQRELLFSALQPSCTGYSVKNGIVNPEFEKSEYEYPFTYLVGEIQSSALDFVREYCSIFGKYFDQMYMRNIEISYPFEHMLAYLEQEDLKIFDCVSFEDDMWAGGTIFLPEQWRENINYHRLLGYYKTRTEYVEKLVYREVQPKDINYAWELYKQKGMEKKSSLSKFIFWLFNDRAFLKKRIKTGIRKK